MSQYKAISRSILFNLSALFLFHSLVFVVAVVVLGVDASFLAWFLFAQVLLFAILVWFLFLQRKDFHLVEQDSPIERVNLANQITLFRITSLPAIILLLLCTRSYPTLPFLVPYLLLAFISDFVDGQVSRRTKQVTRIGMYLDSLSDYAVLIGVAFCMIHFELTPVWFFVAVLVRFLTQWVAMGILYLIARGNLDPLSSFLGKMSVFATMSIFAFEILKLIPALAVLHDVYLVLEIIGVVILAVSLVEKVFLFVKQGRDALAKKKK